MGQGVKLIILVLLVGVLGYVSFKTFVPERVVTVDAGESVASCPSGTIPCPNDCLKREADGWTHLNVKGHPDSDIWMQFVHADGKWEAYNQGHIGHVIEMRNGKYVDIGECPVCRGTTRVCR